MTTPVGIPGAGVSQTEARSGQVKAVASQFEAVLLESVVEGLQKAFAALPGKDETGLNGTYDYLGTQSLAGAWARAGGIGLARLIVAKYANK